MEITRARLYRITTCVAAGAFAVVLPVAIWLGPLSVAQEAQVVELGILASTGAYWLIVRGAGRAQQRVAVT